MIGGLVVRCDWRATHVRLCDTGSCRPVSCLEPQLIDQIQTGQTLGRWPAQAAVIFPNCSPFLEVEGVLISLPGRPLIQVENKGPGGGGTVGRPYRGAVPSRPTLLPG